jgi:XTP/dITP diphosphohydrolase
LSEPFSLVLATGNPGKAREFGRLLGPLFTVEPLPGFVVMPAETEQTFAGNARLKAESVALALGGSAAVLADDSGLQVSRLDGRPGVLSARYAGATATDEMNVAKLLGELVRSKTEELALFAVYVWFYLSPWLAESARDWWKSRAC